MKWKKMLIGSLVCLGGVLLSVQAVNAQEEETNDFSEKIQSRKGFTSFLKLVPNPYEIGLSSSITGKIIQENPKDFDDIENIELYVNNILQKIVPSEKTKNFTIPTTGLTIKAGDVLEVQAVNQQGNDVKNRVNVPTKLFAPEWQLNAYTIFDKKVTGKVAGGVTAIEIVEELANGDQVIHPKTAIQNGVIDVAVDINLIYDETANVKIVPYKGMNKATISEKLPIIAFDLKADIKPFYLNKDHDISGTFTGKGIATVETLLLEVDGMTYDETEVVLDESGHFVMANIGEYIYDGAEVNIVTYNDDGEELLSFPVAIKQEKRIKDYFPDPNLAQAVAEYLGGGKTVDSSVTEEELSVERYAFDQARGKGIKNIEGIQYITGATILFLNYNEIEDISPLGKIRNARHLNNVQLYCNKIKDISPLVEMAQFNPNSVEHLILQENELDNKQMEILIKNPVFKNIIHLDVAWNHIDRFTSMRWTPYFWALDLQEQFWRAEGQKIELPKQVVKGNQFEFTIPAKDIDNKTMDVVENLGDYAQGNTTAGYKQIGNKVTWTNLPSNTKNIVVNVRSNALNGITKKPFMMQPSVQYIIPVEFQ